MRKKSNSPLLHKMLKINLLHFRTFFLMVLLLLFSSVQIREGVSLLEANSVKTHDLDAMPRWVCSGTMGDCRDKITGDDEEEMMDSETNRRILMMRRRFISYDTLRRDLVPCDRPGASYYNCKDPGVANSYNRGCEVITRCARGD